MKLFDSEWKVMEVLWQKNDRTAKEISLRLADTIGWNKNTTYTVIKKCIEKGAIERREPNFTCHAQITKQQAQKEEAETLVEKVFDGSEPQPVKRTEKKYKVFPVSSRALLAAFYAARQSACFSIGVRTPRLR